MVRFVHRGAEGKPAPLGDLPEWMAGLLRARGIETPGEAERFLHPSLEHLHDPYRMPDMDKAVRLIREAIQEKKRILIYGDYDVDGVSATSILLETIREEGGVAEYRIPKRHTEGYGLNSGAVGEIAENTDLLITVDCGISNAKEVREARERGMKVIVTDHHQLPEELPEGDAVLNPLLGDYPFRKLCGAGVALKICQAMQGLDGVRKRIDIAALATVADVVPLTDENRVIVKEGMARMAGSTRPGMAALLAVAEVEAPVNTTHLGFRLAPRINAAGRLEDAAIGVRFLTTQDDAEAAELARRLNEQNAERQAMEKRILDEAMVLLPQQNNSKRDRVVIVEGEGWNAGLVGLVAGRFCEQFNFPTIVLSRNGDKATGSCRSIPGVHILNMLRQVGDLMDKFGGHEQAAGLTIPVENIPAFRERLNRVVKESCDPDCWIPRKEYDVELDFADATLDTVARLEILEPTGTGNPAPVFLTKNCEAREMRRVGKDKSHLKVTFRDGDTDLGGIGFGMGREADRGYRRVDALYRLSRNEFNGTVSAQMQLEAVKPAGG